MFELKKFFEVKNEVFNSFNFLFFDFRLISCSIIIKIIAIFSTGFIVVINSKVSAAPWIDTNDEYLRSDIEILSDIGIIEVPITTYPLPWSGIIKDIDNVDASEVDSEYKTAFWRVKQAGKKALKGNSKHFRVSLSNEEQFLRSFGDESRNKVEINIQRSGLNKRFAWNLEVTRVADPQDNENIRLDGSYGSIVFGNWIAGLGAIERWWGPTWNSASLLSNNARPPMGISIQRNYSNESNSPIFKWFGPWTFSSFVAELDDERTIKNAKLTGASFSFKAHHTLEIGLRATALWGGDARTESFDSLIDNFVANESCILNSSSNQYICDEFYSHGGDRIAGLDLRWKLPLSYPIAFYASVYGEDDTKFLPSKFTNQYGVTSFLKFEHINIKWFLEYTDTTLNNKFNQTYESQVYQSGYRYYGRNIGSSYDNDSEALSFGILGGLDRDNKFSFKISNVKLNQDSSNRNDISRHTLTEVAKDIDQIRFGWTHKTNRIGSFDISISYVTEEIGSVKSRINVSWAN